MESKRSLTADAVVDEKELAQICRQTRLAVDELIEKAKLKEGDLLLVGCSSSEILGEHIGYNSSFQVGKAVFDVIYAAAKENGLYLAAQCCEHLNRAVIIEREAAEKLRLEEVNVRPVPKAGGSFAAAAWESFDRPAAVENVQADAGLDIGLTLIGMNLKKVAVPLRLEVKTIGKAVINAARTRPKFIGGCRAQYNEELM